MPGAKNPALIDDDPRGPHVVTPEMAEEANRLHAEAHASARYAISVERHRKELEATAERLWQDVRVKNQRAREILLGPSADGYAAFVRGL